jgi:hypothetical protein
MGRVFRFPIATMFSSVAAHRHTREKNRGWLVAFSTIKTLAM